MPDKQHDFIPFSSNDFGSSLVQGYKGSETNPAVNMRENLLARTYITLSHATNLCLEDYENEVSQGRANAFDH